MNKKRNLSIDSTIKLELGLRDEILIQLDKFNSSRNEELIQKIKNLFKLSNKKIKTNPSLDEQQFLEISICKLNKLIDTLCKLQGFYVLEKASDQLKQELELDKLRDEMKCELVNLKACELEFENNHDSDNFEAHFDSNEESPDNNEPNFRYYYEPNYSNYYEPNATNLKNETYETNATNLKNETYETNAENSKNETYRTNDVLEDDLSYLMNSQSANFSYYYEPNAENSKNETYETNDESTDEIIDLTSNQSTNDNDPFRSIFKYLSINDLFNCRLVNKKFKKLSDNSNSVRRLIIGKLIENDRCWFYNNELINKQQNIINLKYYKKIRLLKLFNLNINLKYLRINRIDDKEFKFDVGLNNLINLELIEIKNCNFKGNQCLDQLNLKFLIIKHSKVGNLKLKTPKLEKINLSCLESYEQLIYNNLPISTEELVIKSKNDLKINCDFIFKLVNLRTCFIQINQNLIELAIDLISNLEFLNRFLFYHDKKKVEIKKVNNLFDFNYGIVHFEALNFDNLLNEIKLICNKKKECPYKTHLDNLIFK